MTLTTIKAMCRFAAISSAFFALAPRRCASKMADAAPLAVSGCADAIAMRSAHGVSLNASSMIARFFEVGSVASEMFMVANEKSNPYMGQPHGLP